jgi:hypothetical protein
MENEQAANVSREAVGIFQSADDLQSAIDELLSSGFHRAELSLLASESAVEEKLGHTHATAEVLADDPNVPRSAYVSTEDIGDAEGALIGGLVYVGAVVAAVAVAGGALLTVIVSATLVGGAGGLIGAVLAKRLGDHHAHYLQEQIERGGLLLWVRTRDAAKECRAVEILNRHSAGEAHVHGRPLDAEQARSTRVEAT